MANISFGRKQLSNPTPTNVGRTMKIIIACNSAITIWLGTADYIPSFTAKVVGSILSLITLLSIALEPFFGVTTNKKKVDIKNVSAMDEPKTN